MDPWFSRSLVSWYKQNKRDLPWRGEKDPYKIWLSEIILQQTQVAQGLGYFERFVEKYPTVGQLATAPEDEVLKLWQGLGYYSRARNLHHSAKTIVKDFKGKFPNIFLNIRSLKGIGDYTAAAIASFAFNLPHAVVDGNVYRLLARVFGIDTPIDRGPGKKQFSELAARLLDEKNPGIHNQAIMEFGSQYCKPVNPDCPNCVFNSRCRAFAEKRVHELPVKVKKTKIRARYFNYLVVSDKKGRIIVNKRKESDIWKGLYEFCLLETDKEKELKELMKQKEFHTYCAPGFTIKHASKTYKHILSHQHLYARFYVVTTPHHSAANANGKKTLTTDKHRLHELAFPRLIEKFLSDCDLKEIL